MSTRVKIFCRFWSAVGLGLFALRKWSIARFVLIIINCAGACDRCENNSNECGAVCRVRRHTNCSKLFRNGRWCWQFKICKSAVVNNSGGMFRGCTACRLFNSNRISGSLLCVGRDYLGTELAEISRQKLTRRKERKPNGSLVEERRTVHAEFGRGEASKPL
ncbi:hypothetical protein Zmor_021007 [Zophobas morio]|uniref:Uncharacterized protein n=1 Tax=Zophobas morio TaxID=2755281 RepID=A0AA38MAQ3_9CUCU|nr:hypothetical protein Zmor_021007 [Zophobas morio]